MKPGYAVLLLLTYLAACFVPYLVWRYINNPLSVVFVTALLWVLFIGLYLMAWQEKTALKQLHLDMSKKKKARKQ